MPVWRALRARTRFGVDLDAGPRAPFVGRERRARAPARRRYERDAPRVVGAARDRRRRAGRRQDPPRRASSATGSTRERARQLAPGPLPALRRRDRVLGARRDRQGARGHPRVGHAGRGEAKLGAISPRRRRRAERAGSARGSAPLVGLEARTAGDRATEAFAAWRRFLEALAGGAAARARLRGPALGRRGAARASSSTSSTGRAACRCSSSAPPGRSSRAPARLGRRQAQRDHDLALAADRRPRPRGSLGALLERAVLPAETQAALLERAGGNPLYAEEFVRMLARPRAARRGRPSATAAGDGAGADRRAPRHARRRTEGAAPRRGGGRQGLLGRRGRRDRAAATRARCERRCTSCARKELVRPARALVGRGEAEYAFWHVLVRDVAYGQIPRAARAESTAGGRVDRVDGRRARRRPGRDARPPLRSRRSSSPRRRATEEAERCRGRAAVPRAGGRARVPPRQPWPRAPTSRGARACRARRRRGGASSAAGRRWSIAADRSRWRRRRPEASGVFDVWTVTSGLGSDARPRRRHRGKARTTDARERLSRRRPVLERHAAGEELAAAGWRARDCTPAARLIEAGPRSSSVRSRRWNRSRGSASDLGTCSAHRCQLRLGVRRARRPAREPRARERAGTRPTSS